jgi:hypothetical protein
LFRQARHSPEARGRRRRGRRQAQREVRGAALLDLAPHPAGQLRLEQARQVVGVERLGLAALEAPVHPEDRRQPGQQQEVAGAAADGLRQDPAERVSGLEAGARRRLREQLEPGCRLGPFGPGRRSAGVPLGADDRRRQVAGCRSRLGGARRWAGAETALVASLAAFRCAGFARLRQLGATVQLVDQAVQLGVSKVFAHDGGNDCRWVRPPGSYGRPRPGV